VSLSEIGDDSSPHVRPPVRVVVTGHDSRLIHAWRAVGQVTSRAPLRPGVKCTHANAMDHHFDHLPCPVPAGGRVRWRLVQCCARCCLLESPWRNLFCIKDPAACPPMIVIDVLFCQTPNCFRRAKTNGACSSRLDGRCMPPFNFCATATTASSSSARQASY